MGCGVSASKGDVVDREGGASTTTPRQGGTGVESTTRQPQTSVPSDDRQHGEGRSARGAGGGGTEGSPQHTTGFTGANIVPNSNGAAAGSQGAAAQSSVSTYTITDQRGCKVTTVIQNRNKVETMCKWLDNVLKAKDENGGKFLNPQLASRSMAHGGHSHTLMNESNRDTSSVSSRNVFSVASQNLLGVSVVGGSQSRGNVTTAAQHGSEGEEDTFSPTNNVEVEVEGAPPLMLAPLTS